MLTIDLPSSLEAMDCRRLHNETGRLVIWDDSQNIPRVMGKFSVWGAAYSNMSMACKLKGHIQCRHAKNVLAATPDQLDQWLVDGIGKTAAEHMATPLRPGVRFQT